MFLIKRCSVKTFQNLNRVGNGFFYKIELIKYCLPIPNGNWLGSLPIAIQKKNTSTAGNKNTKNKAVIFLHIFIKFLNIKAYNVNVDGHTKLKDGVGT